MTSFSPFKKKTQRNIQPHLLKLSWKTDLESVSKRNILYILWTLVKRKNTEPIKNALTCTNTDAIYKNNFTACLKRPAEIVGILTSSTGCILKGICQLQDGLLAYESPNYFSLPMRSFKSYYAVNSDSKNGPMLCCVNFFLIRATLICGFILKLLREFFPSLG